jgi:hypothetical protein
MYFIQSIKYKPTNILKMAVLHPNYYVTMHFIATGGGDDLTTQARHP